MSKSSQQNETAAANIANASGSESIRAARRRRATASVQWLATRLSTAALIVAVALALLWSVGFALRQGWLPPPTATADNSSAGNASQRYICPMMCVPPTSQPGRCPVCGMELVAATNSPSGDGVSISIQPAHRRLIGLRTANVNREPLNRTIRTIGSVEYDESQLANISAFVVGRLEKLFADYVGVPVQQGDDLAVIYSPELFTAQAEYLTAIDPSATSRFVDATKLGQLAEARLLELGMSESQIKTLKSTRNPQSRIRIQSPQSGTVIEKLAVEGDYVKTGQKIYRVADLSTVWLMMDLFPDDAARVLFGQRVEAEISSAPGEVFIGRVAFIAPNVNPTTRSVRVRVEMQNSDGQLRPGDYATARIQVPAIPQDQVYDPALAGKYISPMHPQVISNEPGSCPICDMQLIPTSEIGFSAVPIPEQKLITVPRDAVLSAGDNSVVYVETEPGRFEVRKITLGTLTEDKAVVIEGLREGEIVAIQGNFLLDSQSQLAGNPSLLDPSKAPKFPPGPMQTYASMPPELLPSTSSNAFDKVYEAYFTIRKELAADQPPSPAAVYQLKSSITESLAEQTLPDDAALALSKAYDAAVRLDAPIEDSRDAFRTVSHALIRVLQFVRGAETKNEIFHFYCPMVPGGGGDWIQDDRELRNPYWGATMLTCGELVNDLSLEPSEPISVDDDDPFGDMEVQTLDLGSE